MGRLTIKAPSGLIHLKDNKESTVNIAIKKLSDYEDFEEQGKLPLLHIGTSIYFIVFGYNEKTDRYEDYIQHETITSVFITKDFLNYTTDSKGFLSSEIGKSIFTDREKAEDALSKLR